MERKQTKQNKQKCSKLGTSPFDFQLTCCMRALSFGFNVISSFSFRKKKRLDLGLDHSYFFMFPWHWAIIGNSRDVVIIFFFCIIPLWLCAPFALKEQVLCFSQQSALPIQTNFLPPGCNFSRFFVFCCVHPLFVNCWRGKNLFAVFPKISFL